MLSLSDKIVVDVKTYDYVKELRRYGPQMQVLLSVESIIEMLNLNVNVIVPDKWVNDIYALVKTYNMMVDADKGKKADVAEERLMAIIDKDFRSKQKKIVNPYLDDRPSATGIQINPKNPGAELPKGLASQGFKTKKKLVIRRPKMTDLLRPEERDVNLPPPDPRFDDVVLDS